jgi:hypothetical protein
MSLFACLASIEQEDKIGHLKKHRSDKLLDKEQFMLNPHSMGSFEKEMELKS